MDKIEARAVLSAELNRFRALPRRVLLDRVLDDQELIEVVGPSGTRYLVEVDAFWDDQQRPGDNLRVIGAISDSGWRTFVPVTDSFIVAPDGSFVGE